MTDWHCHILPGIDDGAADLAESLAMARTLSAAGFTTICCTPHQQKGIFERSAAEIRDRVAQLQKHLTAHALSLQLLAGAEYYLDEFFLPLLADPLPLGNSTRILIELPIHETPGTLAEETCRQIFASGYTPLIAHPERCPQLELEPVYSEKENIWSSFVNIARAIRVPQYLSQNQQPKSRKKNLLTTLRTMGCRFQGDLGSFAGAYGPRVRDKALNFLESGLYDCFGSDAHTPVQLELMLRRGMDTVQQLQSGTENAPV